MSVVPSVREARCIPPTPWLQAVIASGQVPVRSRLRASSRAAASLDTYGSSRSSTTLSMRRNRRPVERMNCHIPAAPTRE